MNDHVLNFWSHFLPEERRPTPSEPTWMCREVLGWGGGERGAGDTLPLLWQWDKPPADCSFRVFIFFKHPKLVYLLIFFFLTLPLTSGKLKGNPHPALLWQFLGRAALGGTGVMLAWMWSWGRTKHKESGWVKMDTPLVPPGRASVGWMVKGGMGLGWAPGEAAGP